jgi:probable F420-dependent oxidoreductase
VRVGISVYGMPVAELVDMAVAADALGFDAVWLGEHVVLPVGYATDHPTTEDDSQHQHIAGPIVDLDTELVDQFVAFGAVAAATRSIRMATGIHLLPLRHPLATARSVCTLQELSGGRFLFGLGAGWLGEEFAALDVPFTGRSARFAECVEVLRRAWRGGPFSYDGDAYAFDPVQVTPRPVEVPLVLGGNTPRALARAATLGDAWFSSGTPSLAESARLRAELLTLRAEAGLDTDGYRTYVRVQGSDGVLVERYGAAGLSDIVVWADQMWAGATPAAKEAGLVAAAVRLGVTPAAAVA